jgi:GH3 auxin-responsive promoter
MKWLVNEIMKKITLRVHLQKVQRYMDNPGEAQMLWFHGLIEAAKYTEFGQQYDFASIRTPEQFAERVPVHDYDAIKDRIARMMRGDRNVLWPGEVTWYSKSSGTTSDKSKFIPITPENLEKNHIAGSWHALALLHEHRSDLEIFRRRNLLMPGSFSALPEHPQTLYGDVSAVLTHHMPFVARWFYTPDFETALMSNFEDKIKAVAEKCSEQDDIVMFGGVPTWLIVLFRMILERTGKANMLEVWPHLQAYMHGGVGFAPYRQTFKELIPSDRFVYQEIYNASEGFFGAQCDFDRDDMLLLADNGVFYEFIPMEEWEKDHPKTVLLADVEVGRNYAVLISSNNGLWRYQPGDTVIFTRKYPHCFRISGRTKQFINTFGEEVMVSDAEKALSQTCDALQAIVAEYTAGPIYFGSGRAGRGGHQWVIEFQKEPINLQEFAELLDTNLQKINSDYEAKRYKSLALAPLKLTAAPPGTFMRWIKERGKLGSQSKVPRLANHRDYLEGVLALIATMQP